MKEGKSDEMGLDRGRRELLQKVIVGGALMTSGLTQASAAAAQKPANGKWAVVEFYDALEKRDIDRIDKVLDDGLVFWVIGSPPATINKSMLMAGIRRMFDVIEGPVRIKIEQMTAEDNRVAAVMVGDMKTKTGLQYNNNYHNLFTVEGGRITHIREYYNKELAASVGF